MTKFPVPSIPTEGNRWLPVVQLLIWNSDPIFCPQTAVPLAKDSVIRAVLPVASPRRRRKPPVGLDGDGRRRLRSVVYVLTWNSALSGGAWAARPTGIERTTQAKSQARGSLMSIPSRNSSGIRHPKATFEARQRASRTHDQTPRGIGPGLPRESAAVLNRTNQRMRPAARSGRATGSGSASGGSDGPGKPGAGKPLATLDDIEADRGGLPGRARPSARGAESPFGGSIS